MSERRVTVRRQDERRSAPDYLGVEEEGREAHEWLYRSSVDPLVIWKESIIVSTTLRARLMALFR